MARRRTLLERGLRSRDPQVRIASLVIAAIVAGAFIIFLATNGFRDCQPHEPTREEAIKMRRDYADGSGRNKRIKRATAEGLSSEDLVIEDADPPCDEAFLRQLATSRDDASELGHRRFLGVRCASGGRKVPVDW
jgi:hypothetical protein